MAQHRLWCYHLGRRKDWFSFQGRLLVAKLLLNFGANRNSILMKSCKQHALVTLITRKRDNQLMRLRHTKKRNHVHLDMNVRVLKTIRRREGSLNPKESTPNFWLWSLSLTREWTRYIMLPISIKFQDMSVKLAFRFTFLTFILVYHTSPIADYWNFH